MHTVGTAPVSTDLALLAGHTYLIEADERDNDVLLEVLDPAGNVMARADTPERRSGTQRAVVMTPPSGRLAVRLTGTEHANVSGTASVRAFDLATLNARPDCIEMVQSLAAADTAYAEGKEISSGHAGSTEHSAPEVFLRAARSYSAAERALAASGDRALRAETQLALASIEYQDLQDWGATADWARAAAATLGARDPYRRARAQELAAEAWIQIGSNGPNSAQVLKRARTEFRRLSDFHTRRGEPYDAALQLSNVTLTYLYEGRYPECAAAALSASRLFGSVHEVQRRAQAWQNRALCLWGMGRLPEALLWFERARAAMGPQPYPKYFVTVSNNTALVDYALGRFDESLRLFDQTLGLAQKIQTQRGEGDSLYGIGVNYYALGDRERARDFLERSLAIRTVAFDGRGRMATLRALATIDAEQGHLDEALARDREALGLAVAPSAIARIRIQLAVHTRDTGRLEEAKAQLDEVLAAGADSLIGAEALLQRAQVLRRMSRLREALADLAVARPRLHRLGSVAEEFEAELELARTLRVGAQPRAALAAVERALALSAALRLQSANPELRSQLQKPLRPAYELKIELLRARYEDASVSGRTQEAHELAALAFATADASRAHSLADVAAQEYPPAVRRALAAEFHHREELYRELAARRYTLDERLDHSGSDDPRAGHLRSDIAELQRRVDAVNTLIATRTSPQAAPVRAPGEGIRLAALPADTALVSYWLGEESAYAWVVTPGGIQWARLPPTVQLTQQVTAFHRSLARLVDIPVERRLQQGREVYELIVRPIAPWLSGAHQWVIVPDGALDYVPFAALRASDQASGAFVASQHDVAFTPAAWMLETRGAAPAPPHPRALLLVADPVYQADDPRLAALVKAGSGAPPAVDAVLNSTRTDYRRLPFTAREAAQISAQFPPGDVDQLTGLNATRERLLALDWSQYRFIHFATHGLVDAQVPQLSALIVGFYDARGNPVDGAIRVADLSLQTLTADVAVFSACDTALGGEVLSEGLVGIGSTTLARGARSVVASLWPVADEIGARLMTEFYQHLLRDSMSPPAALGAAMRSVVSRDASADPAVWAAFQVSVVALGPGLPVRNSGRDAVVTTRP